MKHIKMLILMATLGAGILLPSCHKEEPVDPVFPTENEKRPSGSYGIFMEDAPDQSPFASRAIAARVEYPGGVVTGGGWFASGDRSLVRAVAKPGYIIKSMRGREIEKVQDPKIWEGQPGKETAVKVDVGKSDIKFSTVFVLHEEIEYAYDASDPFSFWFSLSCKSPLKPLLRVLKKAGLNRFEVSADITDPQTTRGWTWDIDEVLSELSETDKDITLYHDEHYDPIFEYSRISSIYGGPFWSSAEAPSYVFEEARGISFKERTR